MTLEITCIDSINPAAWKILSGCADVIVAGGFESHSNKFVRFSTTVQPYKDIGPQAITAVIHADPKQRVSMIEISYIMAEKWVITREACDEFACRSQMRAAAATEKGYFTEEIVSITTPATKKTPEVIFTTDRKPASLIYLLPRVDARPGVS